MRKSLSPLAAAALLSSSALADEFSLRGTAHPADNWTGLYLGLNGGFTGARNTLFIPGAATYTARPNPGAGGIGAQIGYRSQIASGLVVGVEADATWLSGDTKSGPYVAGLGFVPGPLGANRLIRDASLRASLGYSMGALLPYVTGGGAVLDERACTATAAGACVDRLSSTRHGWTLGAGVAYAVAAGWILNAEYRYADFGRKAYVADPSAPGGVRSTLRTQKLLVGLNYRFGAAAPPVVEGR